MRIWPTPTPGFDVTQITMGEYVKNPVWFLEHRKYTQYTWAAGVIIWEWELTSSARNTGMANSDCQLDGIYS